MRALAVVLLLTGCVTPGQSRPMLRWDAPPFSSSPSGWWALSTSNITMYTDLADVDGREAVEAIEQELAVLRAMMGSSPARFKRPVRIFVVADGLEYERYFGRLTAGAVLRGDETVDVFLWGKPEKWARRASMVEGAASLITHELAHVVLDQYFEHQPRWFAEGFAQFLEAYRWSDDGKRVEFGLANLEAYRTYRSNRALGASDVFAWGNATASDGESTTRTLYGYSWALVHFLINVKPERFADILQTLATDGRWTPFQVTQPLDSGALDAAVHAYMKTGDYSTFELEVTRGRESAKQAAMNDADVAGARAVIAAAGRRFSK